MHACRPAVPRHSLPTSSYRTMASNAHSFSLPDEQVLEIVFRFLGSNTHRDYGDDCATVEDSLGLSRCFPQSHYGTRVYRECVRVFDFKKNHGTEECKRFFIDFPNVSALKISLEDLNVYDLANFTKAANPGNWSGENQAYPMAMMHHRIKQFSLSKGGLYASELNTLLPMLGNLEALELQEIGICLEQNPARANEADALERTYVRSQRLDFGSCAATLRTLSIKRSSIDEFPATKTYYGKAKISSCINLSMIPFANLTSLTRLELHDLSPVHNSLIHLSALPNLRSLYLSELDIENEELVPVLQAMRQLSSLVLSRNLSLTFEIFLSLGTKLKHLDISRSNLLYSDARGTEGLAVLEEKKRVENVAVEDVRDPSFKIFLHIFNATSITDLSLNLCHAEPGELELLFSSTINLERLSCLKVGGMNESVIGAISRLRKLTEFNLDFSDVDGAGETLTIRECLTIVADGPCSRSLRKLDISGLSEQHNECARHLLAGRPGHCIVEWPSSTAPIAKRSADCFTLHSGAPGH